MLPIEYPYCDQAFAVELIPQENQRICFSNINSLLMSLARRNARDKTATTTL